MVVNNLLPWACHRNIMTVGMILECFMKVKLDLIIWIWTLSSVGVSFDYIDISVIFYLIQYFKWVFHPQLT